MRILALVITYHPDGTLLKRNIEAFANDVEEIVVWRNSSESLDYLQPWHDKLTLMGEGFNVMLATPINKVADYARTKGFDFILTMDQDSRWVDFGKFKELVSRQWKDNTDVGIYAPNVNGYLKDPCIEYKDIEWVIQSGMLIDLKATRELGGFREDYGIYGIDEEYCYWLRLHGLKVRSFTNCRLEQRYGETTCTRWGFSVLNYSPFVRYRLMRNMIWMKREFSGSTVTRRIPHVYLLNVRDILLGEDNKLKKLTALTRGFIDGLFGKYIAREKR